jgi:hypothetical protein
MTILGALLELNRCPHCNVDKPSLGLTGRFKTTAHDGRNARFWCTYSCYRCGGVILAAAKNEGGLAIEMYPTSAIIHESIPSPARDYLAQAIDSLHSPAGSVMLSASSVDAMLKAKSYKEGNLYERINKAAKDHLITDEMALWAHEVRLDANEQRHADELSPLPTDMDAKKCVEFILALAEFLFVLPSRVSRGRESALEKKATTKTAA